MTLASQDLPNIFDIIQKIVATIAYFVGAFWILMNYFRNRTHVPRLQVDVKAEIVTGENRRYLLATVQVKNLGLSIIKLPLPSNGGNVSEDERGPYGCVLMLACLRDDESASEAFAANWDEDVLAFDVLEHHTSIEPGLTLNQQKLMRLPDREDDGWWVRLRVLAHKQSWSAVAIALPETKA
jgi:hypothetical protein